MRQINSKAAAGTLLFGGVLGAATSASAGLTWTSAQVYMVAGNLWASTDLGTVLAGNTITGDGASLSLSPVTSSGFSLTSASTGGVWSIFDFTLNFSTDSATTISLAGNTAADSNYLTILDNATSSVVFSRYFGDASAWNSGDLTLGAGNYSVIINTGGVANGGTDTGDVLVFTVVPAPGAVALVGMAGLITGRRRKA
jgi:hypothetical protein